ncbi:spermidine/putrescine ABC transporter substrate-binding protein [Saxibacter everestensis]|uniref:Spermidine/putrescine ABC transporter substrate-binding protein n=1 Tax=Saxibacter everestensis TaxID=2909229 RepID=A0ABY8QZT9_9MICO|nr:spermidine/putrescine ABC transporter substrate-binding protein [Brevibacteriaceae bacterium ZFBP1038]
MTQIRVLSPRSVSARISRRALLSGFGVLGAGAALGGCGRSKAVATSPAPDGEVESKLNLYSWGDYEDPADIAKVEKAAGITVQSDSFGSNEELIAKLAASRGTSGYDVVVPTGIYIPQMAEHNLLQKLDHSLIPNFANIDPNYRDQAWDPHNEYAVCKCWGTSGYIYDSSKISRPMETWADFLAAAKDEASGELSVMEDAWEVCAVWLAAEGLDINTTSAAELEDCRKALTDDLAPHVKAYLSTVTSGVAQGSFSLMHAFNGDARQAILEVEDAAKWKYVYPTPTANLWMDTWAIATGAPHPDAAHAFINTMLEPEIAVNEVDYIGYHTGIKNLKELASDLELDEPDLVFPDQEILDRLTPAVLRAQEERVRILNEMQSRSGA